MELKFILIAALSGAITGYAVSLLMTSKLIEKLDAIEVKYREEVKETAINAINSIYKSIHHT